VAISELYVDPSIAGDSGNGEKATPYGDLEYCLEEEDWDAVNGIRVNIKAGTDEILGAALDLSTYGAPTADALLIFQGYTSAANDGGIGGISGNGSYGMFAVTTTRYISLIDLHMHNSGAAVVVDLNLDIEIINCEIDNTSSDGVDFAGHLINCYIHNCGGYGVEAAASSWIYNNYFENGANDFNAAIRIASGVATFNIVSVDGSSDGIVAVGNNTIIQNNTVFSISGTGEGINILSSISEKCIVMSNYVEGFSGVGGDGILVTSGSSIIFYQSNRFYNNTTHESFSGIVYIDNDNSAVASSALTNPGGGDFSVGTDLKAGAYPTTFKGSSTSQFMDIGAAQREEVAATTNIILQGRHNVLLRR